MIPTETLASTKTSDGTEVLLLRRDEVYRIVVGGIELMSSRAHGSEATLARLACVALARASAPRVLVGGLGMGYTLRAALDTLPTTARIEVAEVLPQVVQWNRGPLRALALQPLEDRRVTVHEIDVSLLLGQGVLYDAIILDVDNGPHPLSLSTNAFLYGSAGLDRVRGSLVPRGVIAVWSLYRDSGFERRLRRAGFSSSTTRVSSNGKGRGPWSTIFLGTR